MLELNMKSGKLVVQDSGDLAYTDNKGNLLDTDLFLEQSTKKPVKEDQE